MVWDDFCWGGAFMSKTEKSLFIFLSADGHHSTIYIHCTVFTMNESSALIKKSGDNSNQQEGNVDSQLAFKEPGHASSFYGIACFCFAIFLFFGTYQFQAIDNIEESRQSTCVSEESFQESAQRSIPGAFSKLDANNRQTAEFLVNRLGIFTFAYFPLDEIEITYAMWDFDKKNPGGQAPSEPQIITTNDPVEIILYYSASLHIIIGDLQDAMTGSSHSKIDNLAKLKNSLQMALLDVLSRDIAENLSWEKYFAYPGPQGRVWPDATSVWWSRQSKERRVLPADALYLETNNRHQDNQLWGSHRPRSGDTTIKAFARLIRNQIQESKQRYTNIVDMDPTGRGNWATIDILSDMSNIDIFHKFRKISRTLGMTIDTYPEAMSPFYLPIPQRVLQFANDNFNAGIDGNHMLSYGDIFCFGATNGDGGDVQSFSFYSSSDQVCTEPLYPVANMLFIGDKGSELFTPEFFGLSEQEFRSLRAMLLTKGVLLGHRVIFSQSLGCPAKHDSYRVMKVNSTVDTFDPVVDNWIAPHYSPQLHAITGTVCELEDFFGSVHDLLVRIQQKSPLVNDNFMSYTEKVAQCLQNFTESIDVEQVLDDIILGLCK
jgi:hypothetical protein